MKKLNKLKAPRTGAAAATAILMLVLCFLSACNKSHPEQNETVLLDFLSRTLAPGGQGFNVTPTSGLITTEAGGTASFTVALRTAPTADVSFNLSSSNTAEGTVAPTSLLFTSANWQTAQTVTVTGVDDVLMDGPQAYTIITAAATSADKSYDGLNPADVSVTNSDNDTPGVQITESGGTTTATEGGATDTYTVVLMSQPTGNVTITLGPNAQVTALPSPLTFTTGACPGPGNWCTPQTVTVTAVDDATVEGAHSGSITHTAVSGDAGYNGIAISSVTVAITDNDPSPIYLFRSAALTDGNLGGRAGADATCAAARGALTFPNNSCASVRAVISINDSGDAIADMATNYTIPAARAVHGPTGTAFQTNWADFLNGVELVTAEAAGILPTTSLWWSFSQTSGAGHPAQHCTNGTGTGGNGRHGGSDQTGGNFFNSGQQSCALTAYVLCVCY